MRCLCAACALPSRCPVVAFSSARRCRQPNAGVVRPAGLPTAANRQRNQSSHNFAAARTGIRAMGATPTMGPATTAGLRRWLSGAGLRCWLSGAGLRCWLSGAGLRCWRSGAGLRCWLSGAGLRRWLSGAGLRCWLSGAGLRRWLSGAGLRCWRSGAGLRRWRSGAGLRCWLSGGGLRCELCHHGEEPHRGHAKRCLQSQPDTHPTSRVAPCASWISAC